MSAGDLPRLSLPPLYGRTSRALLAFRHVRRLSRFPASRLPARRDCIMRLVLNPSRTGIDQGKRRIAAGQEREKYFENFFARLAPRRHNRRSARISEHPGDRAAGERRPHDRAAPQGAAPAPPHARSTHAPRRTAARPRPRHPRPPHPRPHRLPRGAPARPRRARPRCPRRPPRPRRAHGPHAAPAPARRTRTPARMTRTRAPPARMTRTRPPPARAMCARVTRMHARVHGDPPSIPPGGI